MLHPRGDRMEKRPSIIGGIRTWSSSDPAALSASGGGDPGLRRPRSESGLVVNVNELTSCGAEAHKQRQTPYMLLHYSSHIKGYVKALKTPESQIMIGAASMTFKSIPKLHRRNLGVKDNQRKICAAAGGDEEVSARGRGRRTASEGCASLHLRATVMVMGAKRPQ